MANKNGSELPTIERLLPEAEGLTQPSTYYPSTATGRSYNEIEENLSKSKIAQDVTAIMMSHEL